MRKRRKITAWIAIAAMLFGAVSPALAAALFAGDAEILGRMLAIPAALAPAAPHAAPQTAAAEDDGCPHDTAENAVDEESSHRHGGAGGGPDEKTEHAAHGVVCSFCLIASSVVTLLPAQLVPLVLLAAGDLFDVPSLWHDDVRLSPSRARGPPLS